MGGGGGKGGGEGGRRGGKREKEKKKKKSDQYPSRVIQRKREREKSHQYLPKPGNPAPGFQAQGLLVVTDGRTDSGGK